MCRSETENKPNPYEAKGEYLQYFTMMAINNTRKYHACNRDNCVMVFYHMSAI